MMKPMRTTILLALAAPAILAAQSAAPTPVRPQNAPYKVSAGLKEVSNLSDAKKKLRLAPEHLQALQKNLFVVAPGDDVQLYWVYGGNDYQDLPSIITTDSAMELYRVFFANTLRVAEQRRLEPLARQMTAKLLRQTVATHRAAPTPELKAAALKNIAFVGVAANALGLPTTGLPPGAVRLIQDETRRITAARGRDDSPIFGFMVDYSQFIVRGHYTRSPALKRYFRALMWYGLVPLPLAAREGGRWVRRDEQIRQTLLLVRDLYGSGAIREWQLVYNPTSVFVGGSDALTPPEIRAIAGSVFGPNPPIVEYSGGRKFEAFVEAFANARRKRIVSKAQAANLPDAAVQFRLMGQRYIADSEVLQRLTGEARMMPTGLDVMAVLGSPRARQILDANPARYNPKRWAGYIPERAKLIQEFAAIPESTWNSNLYYGWLACLREQIRPAPVGYPSFMRSAAWEDKSLNSALGSWAGLRQATILYGTQSVAEQGDGENPPFVRHYVEPNLPFWDRLMALTRKSRTSLGDLKAIDPRLPEMFKELEDLLGLLRSCAARQLENKPISRAEHNCLRHVEGTFEFLTSRLVLLGTNYLALTEDDRDMAVVADVHTAGASALHAATGRANTLLAIVPIEGKLVLARGSVYSYYEFVEPVSGRLTTEAWKKRLREGKVPPVPGWTTTFRVKTPVKSVNED